MNFNMLLCDMQFIDPKGDTLEISKTEDIDSIQFKNAVFYFTGMAILRYLRNLILQN